MADISFNCPHCSQHFEAPPEMAGDKLPCPTCEKEITVPAAAPAAPVPAPKMVTPPPGDKPPAPQSMAPPTKAPSLKVPGKPDEPEAQSVLAAALASQPEESADAEGGDKCPECQADLAPGAAICIQCGFNLKTGQKLGTDIGAAPAEAEEPAPEA